MKILLIAIFLCSLLFSKDISQIREENIKEINSIIKIYKNRLSCLKGNQAKECIKKYPLNQHNDQLSMLMCSEFPISYYKNILQRDIRKLEKTKICVGKALNEKEMDMCKKN